MSYSVRGQLILVCIVQGGQYILGYDVRGTMCPRISCLVGTKKGGGGGGGGGGGQYILRHRSYRYMAHVI